MYNYRSQPQLVVNGLGADEPSHASMNASTAATVNSARADAGALPAQTQHLPLAPMATDMSKYRTAYMVLGAVSSGVSAYHGYKRNRSVGWAVVWGLLGGLFPVITPAVAIAQGFGKRAK